MKASAWIGVGFEPSGFMTRMLDVEKSGESRSKAILSPAGAYSGVKSWSSPGQVRCLSPVPSERILQIAECRGLQQFVSKTIRYPSGDQSYSKGARLLGVSGSRCVTL